MTSKLHSESKRRIKRLPDDIYQVLQDDNLSARN